MNERLYNRLQHLFAFYLQQICSWEHFSNIFLMRWHLFGLISMQMSVLQLRTWHLFELIPLLWFCCSSEPTLTRERPQKNIKHLKLEPSNDKRAYVSTSSVCACMHMVCCRISYLNSGAYKGKVLYLHSTCTINLHKEH